VLKPRTHFEQVPLELVRKIMEEQARGAKAAAALPKFDRGEVCPKQAPERPN
jgi:hypothetical protein